MLTQLALLAIEVEGTEGTAETLDGSDVITVFNPNFEPVIEPAERDPVRPFLSPHPSVFGKRSARMRFSVEVFGGSAGAAVHFADAFKACGMGETLVVSTSATYKPASSSIPSATLTLYMDGVAYKLWGARGTFTLIAEAGKPVRVDFDFLGADFSVTDVALSTLAPSYATTIPPVCQALTLTIDSYAALVTRFEIAQNNTLVLRPSVSASSGHKSTVITNRKPTFSFDPENVLVSSEDFFGNWRAGTQMAFTTGTIGSSAGNRITITAPKVQYQGVTMTERDGLSALDVSAVLCADSYDDEWVLAIT